MALMKRTLNLIRAGYKNSLASARASCAVPGTCGTRTFLFTFICVLKTKKKGSSSRAREKERKKERKKKNMVSSLFFNEPLGGGQRLAPLKKEASSVIGLLCCLDRPLPSFIGCLRRHCAINSFFIEFCWPIPSRFVGSYAKCYRL